MKNHFAIWITALLLSNAEFLQGAPVASQPAPVQTVNIPPPTPYAITVQNGNSRKWERTTYEKSSSGGIVTNINSYTELATGLNHLVNGQWVGSKEEIDIQPNGTAQAVNGQHQAYFPGDIYNGEIELVTPDGVQLHSRPMGLSYFDGQKSVLIAELTNSVGVVSGNNQVIYPNAFTDFKADLVYTYTKAGFEQDIVLREQPPTPESFGLNAATARLQVLTEFFGTAEPVQSAVVVNHKDGLSDTTLAFGQMKMVPGKAFAIGDTDPVNPNTKKIPVYKSWQVLDGRTFLVEELPVQRIATQLEQLPMPASAIVSSAQSVIHKVSATRLLPPTRLAQTGINKVQLARVEPAHKSGLVLDYVTLNSVSGDLTFQGDTTYYISTPLASFGTVTVEGGTVVKFDPYSYLCMYDGAIVCKTAPYRPAILTSKNDDTVGDVITGSTGSPTAVWPTFAVDSSLSGSTTGMVLHDMRFCYMCNGIGWYSEGDGPYYLDIWNCQFVNCIEGFNVHYYLHVGFHNVLFSGCTTAVGNNADADDYTVSAEQVTADVGSFGETPDPSWMTNSIILESSGPTATLIGNSVITTSPILPLFQTVGAGNYYLTNGSPYRNVGTTNISPALLAGLRQRTTYPPIIYSNVIVSTDLTLAPQAQRDTDIPDLGYHYDPLDYFVDYFQITNAVLTLTNGVAIAADNDSAGIWLQDGSSIVSIGSPLYPNWLVRYSSVQEQPVAIGGTPASASMVNPYHWSVAPNGQYRFTKFACQAGSGNHLVDTTFPFNYDSLLVQDCEFWSGANSYGGYSNTVITLNNNLFWRSSITSSTAWTNSLSVSNNLFFGISRRIQLFNMPAAAPWYAFNNVFDTCFIAPAANCTNGYNAYINSTNRINPTNAFDIVLTNAFVYQTGPLGGFYQPTSSPLINMGSTTADQVGLYHYTVITNEVPETNSVVDMGYHYVATDAYGNPLDTDGDGIPDYIEDANGNGIFDAGDPSDWQTSIYGAGPLAFPNGLNIFMFEPKPSSQIP